MLEIQTIRGRNLVSLRVTLSRAREAAVRLHLAERLIRTNGQLSSSWLGPDHWLLMSTELTATAIIKQCQTHLNGITHNATDQTDAFTILEVVGSSARELLSTGCSLDFRPQSFPKGACQRTRLAQIQTTICANGENEFELVFDRSFNEYLRSWIAESESILRVANRT